MDGLADFKVEGIPGQASFGATPGQANGVVARFYMDSHYMPEKSREAGRPIAEQREMVEIMQIGERIGGTVKLHVDDTHRERFSRQYDQFKKGLEQIETGTPLAMLFPANPEVVAELKHFHVHTVEGLLQVPDSANARIPFLTDWKNRARQYMDGAQKGKGFHELEKRLADSEAKNADLMDRLAALESRLTDKKKGA